MDRDRIMEADTVTSPDSSASGRSRALLLVDDEPAITTAIMRLLRPDGYRVFAAYSGEDGLRILEGAQVQVIVSDQRMPGMSGSEFLSRVAEHYPDTVRLLLSGHAEQCSIADAIDRGVIDKFLSKPWDNELLREEIRQAFVQYESRRQDR